MSRSSLLKRINKAISPNKVDFSGVDSEITALKQKLEETVNIQTVDDVKSQLDKFKKKIDLSPLLDEINKIGETFSQRTKELQSQIDEKSNELDTAKKSITSNEIARTDNVKKLSSEISSLRSKLAELEVFHQADITSIDNDIKDVRSIEGRVNNTIDELTNNVNTKLTKKDAEKTLKETQDKLDELRRDLLTRISNIGGGSMNRQMFIGGVDPLKTYTDMNLKAGTNVTITYANNNTTKKVDVTFSSTGGGGGSVRSINSVSTNTAAGSTSGTDYVYLCSGTMTLTLPDATTNTNLYTIKNVGTGVLTIATTSAQTIDGTTTITMPVQYTAVDLISDSANWNVT